MAVDFLYASVLELLIRDKRYLVQNTEYRFNAFNIITERFEQESIKVFQPDLSKDEFVVTSTSPTAVGDYNNLKYLVTPRSNKYPNGSIIRYWFDTYSAKMFTSEAIRTTKEKATKQ